MKFSTKVRYGLRILLQIACDSADGGFVQGKDIAKKQNISEAYLEQIMIPLKNAGFVKTARGCSGGYALKKKISDISVLDLIELFEGKIYLADCVEDSKSCKMSKDCQARRVWQELSQKFRQTASEFTLDKIVKDNYSQEYSI